MDRKTLSKANELASNIEFIDDQIGKLTTRETETTPDFRIEANLTTNGSFCSSELNHAILTSEQKSELHTTVLTMLRNNKAKLEKELEEL